MEVTIRKKVRVNDFLKSFPAEYDPDFYYFDPETGEPIYDDLFSLFDPEGLDEDLPFD